MLRNILHSKKIFSKESIKFVRELMKKIENKGQKQQKINYREVRIGSLFLNFHIKKVFQKPEQNGGKFLTVCTSSTYRN